MKRLVLLVLFSLIVSNAFAQVDTQFRWIIGTWVDDDGNEWVFRDNGTLVLDGDNFYYSIGPFYLTYGNILKFFPQYQGERMERDTLYFLRINNQKMIILLDGTLLGGTIDSPRFILNKRN